MKKIKFIITCLVVFTLFACTQDDANLNSVYDNVNGQTGVGFTSNSREIIVPITGGITTSLAVQSTTISSSERSFPVTIDPSSTGSSDDYSFGTITIPANSHEGSLDITFGNFDNLPDLVFQSLVLNLDLPANVPVIGFDSATINYLKFVICNDLVLNITPDSFASETTWQITDSAGATVQSGGPYADMTAGIPIIETFTLPDGDYTFTIFDAFGDGLFDGNNTGTYSLMCSILTHASGSGNFGASQSTDFRIN